MCPTTQSFVEDGESRPPQMRTGSESDLLGFILSLVNLLALLLLSYVNYSTLFTGMLLPHSC